ncbi:MAG: hypothetical protein XD93_0687 [candidate division WS6 bacterium 34_10]|uniref:Cohesin domain-containing protein n=1 Tax=candidate division WS6 bacterium 34_10 TaxID=1641389 RepID=A0A101HHC0_9BACT|nr:MAG: hypothetical protein XD93_0687 [candidate division WS6 bacterium 34_10]
MNCLKKITIAISVIIITSFFTQGVFSAYSSLSLSPSSGTIPSTETAISVVVDSGTDEFIGIDLNLSYTGPVEYVRAEGADRCSSFVVSEGTGTINIECISMGHTVGETYSDTVANLYFYATDSGSSVFSFTSSDPVVDGGLPADSTYTLSTGSTSDSTDTEVIEGSENLPQTGLFDNSGVILTLGVFLVIVGLSFTFIINKWYQFNYELDQMEIEKSRSRLEDKF